MQVARGGIEPPTYRFSGGRSYQLSYLAKPKRAQTTRPPKARPPRWVNTNRTVGVWGLGPQRNKRAAKVCAFRRHKPSTALATLTGLEPATFAVTGRRANQLRHRAMLYYMLSTGLEPALPP